jgi:ubiquinone/menaquinone biosynthesis C-methylase UbiE
MIRQARRRVAAARVEWLVADARTLELPSASFDAIVTNFFLDCFPAAELSLLIARLAPLLKDGGHWFDGDFRPPTHCLGQWHLTLMYHFFRWQTKLGTMQLIDPAPALIQSGFTLQSEYPAVGGYLSARWWRR